MIPTRTKAGKLKAVATGEEGPKSGCVAGTAMQPFVLPSSEARDPRVALDVKANCSHLLGGSQVYTYNKCVCENE
jgi:hypothetical protein